MDRQELLKKRIELNTPDYETPIQNKISALKAPEAPMMTTADKIMSIGIPVLGLVEAIGARGNTPAYKEAMGNYLGGQEAKKNLYAKRLGDFKTESNALDKSLQEARKQSLADKLGISKENREYESIDQKNTEDAIKLAAENAKLAASDVFTNSLDIKDPILKQAAKSAYLKGEGLTTVYSALHPKPIGKPSGSGVEKPKLTKMSAGQISTLSDLGSSLDVLDQAASKFKPEWAKPILGETINAVATKLGDKDRAEFETYISNFKNVLLKARSGAAVTNQEYDRFLKEVGDLNQRPDAWYAKVNGIYTTIKDRYNRNISDLQKSNIDVGQWKPVEGKTFITPVKQVKSTYIPEFKTEQEAEQSGYKGEVKINGRRAEIQ